MTVTLTTNAAQKLRLASVRPSSGLNRHEVKGRGMTALRKHGLLTDEGKLTPLGREVAKGLTVFDPTTGQARLNLNAISRRYGGTPVEVAGTTFQIEAL